MSSEAEVTSVQGSDSVAETCQETCQETSQLGPTFSAFLELPSELRIRIWKFAVEPRFVGLRFDKARFKIPALLHACSESRYESKKHLWTLHAGEYGLIANPTTDFLLMDETSFYGSAPYGYHNDSFHSLACTRPWSGPVFFDRSHFKDFTKICISLAEVYAIWAQECLHCFLQDRFTKLFPSVREINIVLRQGPEGASPEDMYIVNIEDEGVIQFHKDTMSEIMGAWKRCVQEMPEHSKIVFQFVRVERWER